MRCTQQREGEIDLEANPFLGQREVNHRQKYPPPFLPTH